MKRSPSNKGRQAKQAGVRHPKWLLSFMLLTILAIAGFQGYWLRDNYHREQQSLEIKTNAAFRQTILRLQASKLKLDPVDFRWDSTRRQSPAPEVSVRVRPREQGVRASASTSIRKEPVITLVNLVQEKVREIDLPDSIEYPYGKVMLTGLKDTLTRVVDSLQRIFKTSLPGMAVTLPFGLDSLDPEAIKEMAVGKKSSGRTSVTIQYNNTPSKDSSSHHKNPISGDVPLRITSMPASFGKPNDSARNTAFRFFYDLDSISLKDSVTVQEVTDAYSNRLKGEKINLGFAVSKVDKGRPDSAIVNEVTIGFSNPITYHLTLKNQVSYILGKLKLPILFSLLLVGITIASFVALYRSLLRQHRLAQIKNDLISNITHELKTPIATVSVAIEALKNFNAMQDPLRTREYLDISQNELQRLGLLVDKVLKLSMFENKEIELKYEFFDLREVINEVVASLRLQLEKHHAKISITSEGDTSLKGDRLHLLSVVFNLLDNALKYSKDSSEIQVSLKQLDEQLELQVTDNGIGIPAQYKDKVFEKFFRVPAGDTHNAKGHGLGLSYVAQVVRQHNGTIKVDSREGFGSTFTIILPKQST